MAIRSIDHVLVSSGIQINDSGGALPPVKRIPLHADAEFLDFQKLLLGGCL
jgi:hypothetical protein